LNNDRNKVNKLINAWVKPPKPAKNGLRP